MMTWGFPCQDISVAGKLAGIKEGTRSGLYYEGMRILKQVKPKYSIIENVKNLTSKKFKESFEQILKDLEDAGYNNYWQVLNAKNFGIPQNRERVFIISIRKDIDKGTFEFPEPFDNGIRLKDILEDKVEEKYFLSEKMIQGFIAHNQNHKEKGTGFIWKPRDKEKHASAIRANAAVCPTDNTIVECEHKVMVERIGGLFDKEGERHQAGSVYDKDGIAPPLDTMQGGYRQPMINVINATKKGYDTATVGDSINTTYPYSNKKRGRVGHGVAQTLDTGCGQATIVKTNYPEYRIRRLTPLECWRLMGFDDEDFHKAKGSGMSDTQLYKQAGNSIVVNVLEEILKKLLLEED